MARQKTTLEISAGPACLHCGDETALIRRQALPGNEVVEARSYECKACGRVQVIEADGDK
jgi:hypothetical protein